MLRRTGELFASISGGRYQLTVDENREPPEFRAIDTVTGRGHSLSELSSGTRVQLLLSVRMAFVETQEHGPKLPLILDETLANSDPQREREIIEAAIEICKRGRQVFYFTCKPHEVDLWQASLAHLNGNVDWKVIDLAEVRRFDESQRMPQHTIERLPQPTIPSPNGMSHADYGRCLQAPGFDPRNEDIGGTHLWHLINDVEVLYSLLTKGIQQWGPFKTIVEHGGTALVSLDVFKQAQASAKVLESAACLWRIGRGKPIDRQTIIDSGAVSINFLELVLEAINKCDREARQLMTALENRGVRGFRETARHKLNEYLVANGYLDTREPLSLDTIRYRVVASVSIELAKGDITLHRVDELLEMLPSLVTRTKNDECVV